MFSLLKNNYPYLETFFISLLFVGLGLLLSTDDPLFLRGSISFSYIFILIITLYYGIRKSILTLGIFTVVFFLYYPRDMLIPLLELILIVLISGQFYHFWHKRYEKEQKESAFKSMKLEELSNAFYTLKISHDSLEKSYALKPHSLRSSVRELQNFFFDNQSHYENFLHLISKAFHVQGSSIALLQKGTFKTIASIEGKKRLDIQDPLVAKALQRREMSYVTGNLTKQSSKYLAVIPVKNQNEEVYALLAIDKMPFLDFNQNNLISINILLAYFMDQIKLWTHLQKEGHDSITQNALFAFHFNSMLALRQKYNTSSTVLVLKPQDALSHEKLLTSLNTNLRGLDRYTIVQETSKEAIMILLPFTSKAAIDPIINKIFSHAFLERSHTPHMGFDIQDKSLVQTYLKEV